MQQVTLRVKGHLDSQRSAWFSSLTITPLQGGLSTLSGQVADQAALYGLLARIRDLGLELISVQIDEAEPEEKET